MVKIRLKRDKRWCFGSWRPGLPGTQLLLAVLLLPAYSSAWAQSCNSHDIEVGSQAEADGFQATYGPCDTISGSLEISGSDITDLTGLAGITSIDRLDIRHNEGLSSLDGLSSLLEVSSLNIESNPLLANLQGLENVESIWTMRVFENDGMNTLTGLSGFDGSMGGSLTIWGNDALESLEGLNALRSVAQHFNIVRNSNLQNLDALSNVVSLASINVENNGIKNIDGIRNIQWASSVRIWLNSNLLNLDGFQNLRRVENGLEIRSNSALISAQGLGNLQWVGIDLEFSGNPSLEVLPTFEDLENVGGDLQLSELAVTEITGFDRLMTIGSRVTGGTLYLSANENLEIIDALPRLRSIGHSFVINENPELQEIEGFQSLVSVGRTVAIVLNPKLSDCSQFAALLDDYDHALPGPGPSEEGIPDVGWNVLIDDNGDGCNDVPEIIGNPARFRARKTFDDSNPAGVNVNFTCNNGSPLSQTAVLSEDSGFVTFVLTDYEFGATNCSISEEPILGYSGSYEAYGISSWDTSPAGCEFLSIGPNDTNTCEITNSLDEVSVEVSKTWVDEHPEFHSSRFAIARFECENAQFGPSLGYVQFTDEIQSTDFRVHPHWNGSTLCRIEEVNIPDGIHADDEDCQNLAVSPGRGNTCELVNTYLYEGIPTLSRSGLAVLISMLALLGLARIHRTP